MKRGRLAVVTSSHNVDMADLDHLIQFEEWLRSWGAAPDTVHARVTTIRAVLRTVPADDATAEDLAAWLARPDFAPWTRATYFGHLRSFYGWLATTGRRADNPTATMRAPRTPKALPRPLSDDEVARALDGADARMHAWLTFGLYAGLRAHETAKLDADDIRGDTIYVVGKGGSKAYLPIHAAVRRELDALPGYGWLFPGRGRHGHIAPEYLSNTVARYFTSLGIDGSYHRCRHTYATRLLRAGVNIRVVQTLMRHANMSTTAAYLGVDDAERRAAVDLLAG